VEGEAVRTARCSAHAFAFFRFFHSLLHLYIQLYQGFSSFSTRHHVLSAQTALALRLRAAQAHEHGGRD
jgi:hypothetical protein